MYLLGATGLRGRELGAGYVMHWWTIDWLRQLGCRRYDLGVGSDLGIRQFKTALVGQNGALVELYRYELCRRATSRIAVEAGVGIKRMWEPVHDALWRMRHRA
jgi:CelD/BcsL family acetyltransferase involved in cellulose biosynthesis